MTLRPRHARGCRGRASTERSKAKYEAKKAERNQAPSKEEKKLSSIGRGEEPKAPDRNRVNSSQGKQHAVLEELHSIGRGDEPIALGQNRVNSSQDSQDTEQDHLKAYGVTEIID